MSTGPFQRYPVSGPSVLERGNAIATTVEPLTGVLGSVQSSVRGAISAVGGDLLAPLSAAPRHVERRTQGIVQAALVGAGAVRVFAGHVSRYDAGVDSLNARWATAQAHGFGVPLADAGDEADAHAAAVSLARAGLLSQLRQEHRQLEGELDDCAGEVAGLLDAGPVDDTVVDLYRAGGLPLAAMSFFPGVSLSFGDHVAAWRSGFGPGGSDEPPTLQEILEQYQVRDDPDGMVTWPPWPLSMAVDEEIRVTATEAEILNRLGLLALQDMQEMRSTSFSTADERYVPLLDANGDPLQNDNHNDAFRHAYWNALMTRRFGEDWAKAYGDAHEGVPGNQATREAMDLYNNGVGRRIAAANPDADEQELAELIDQAVRNGEVLVIGPDGELAWSNTVPVNGTGTADGGEVGPAEGNPDIDPDENADPDSHNDGGTGS